jgi:hypothetical protein
LASTKGSVRSFFFCGGSTFYELSWWAARVFSFTVKMEKSWAKMASLLEI